MKRILFPVLLVVGLLLAACAPASPAADGGSGDAPAEEAASIIRLGIDAADLGTLDPHFAATTNDRAVVDMIFNALVRYVPGGAPEIEADLARVHPRAGDHRRRQAELDLCSAPRCHVPCRPGDRCL